jgi:hypothetical protein
MFRAVPCSFLGHIVLLQHLVSSLSVNGRTVRRLRAEISIGVRTGVLPSFGVLKGTAQDKSWRWRQNAISKRNYIPVYTASHSRRLEASATPLWEPQISQRQGLSRNMVDIFQLWTTFENPRDFKFSVISESDLENKPTNTVDIHKQHNNRSEINQVPSQAAVVTTPRS